MKLVERPRDARPRVALALALALAWSGASFAGTTANLGVVSEYIARGIQSSKGVAVQGGLDWAGESGAYVGTWASAIGGPAAAGDVELDFYGGWVGTLGEAKLDLGLVYYCYAEAVDDLTSDYDYAEVYAEVGFGYATLQLYYAPKLFGDGNEAAADLVGRDSDGLYAAVIATFPLTETLSLVAQAGHASGDGLEVAYGDSYSDYSVSLAKAFARGVTFTIGVYDTTLAAGQAFGTVSGDGDEPKVVAGLKKAFEL